MNKKYIKWNDFQDLVKVLANKIKKDKYNSLYGIPRGGIHVAQALRSILKLPLVISPQEKTLIIDDVADSGYTLSRYDKNDTAVLHLKTTSKIIPTYFAEKLDCWIVYPWERLEEDKAEGLQDNIRRLLQYLGEDINREELKETPKRVQKAWEFWTSGYGKDSKSVMKVFKNPGIDQLIVVPKIDFYSHCEHHLAPFYGQIHIGYVPNGKVLGVSKFARLVEIYARRLQIQERLTQQIADDIMKYLDPQGVGVVIRGIHLCMISRGVEKQNTEMVTSAMLVFFRDKPELRAEFLALINEKI